MCTFLSVVSVPSKKTYSGGHPYGLSCSKRLFRKVFSYVPPVRYTRPLDHLVGGAVASWSVRWTLDLAVRVLKAPGNYRTRSAVLLSIPDGSFKKVLKIIQQSYQLKKQWTSLEVRTHPTFLKTDFKI